MISLRRILWGRPTALIFLPWIKGWWLESRINRRDRKLFLLLRIRFMAGRFKVGRKVCVVVGDVFFLSVSKAPAGRTHEAPFFLSSPFLGA
jgi:hypothetical protein